MEAALLLQLGVYQKIVLQSGRTFWAWADLAEAVAPQDNRYQDAGPLSRISSSIGRLGIRLSHHLQ